MPILDLAPRFSDSYRVRLGDLAASNRPRALTDRIRVTAAGPEAPQAFADVYGSVDNVGVTEWEDDKSPDCFQVYLPISALPIWIMPGQVLTQWWERYRGKVCERRCEGTGGQETLSGEPCLCSPNIDERIADRNQCSIMTRLSIMCPEVKTLLGSGSLVTHSEIAAGAFQGAMYLAGPWLSKNVPVAATLRTHTHKGRTTFTFPVLEIGGPVDRTPELDAGPQVGQIEAGSAAAPALEAGSQREEAARTAPPAPPHPEPFTDADEVYVDERTWRKFLDACRQNGLDVSTLCKEATGGRASHPRHVRVDEWDALLTLFATAQTARQAS